MAAPNIPRSPSHAEVFMSLTLGQHESVRAATRRVLRKRIERTVALIEHRPTSDRGEEVHEARKQIKQARALLKLLRTGARHRMCSRIDRRLRKVARALSGIRDATVLLQRLSEMQRRAALSHASVARLRVALEICQERAYAGSLATPAHRARLVDSLRDAQKQIARLPAAHKGWTTIGTGLRNVYKAARVEAAVAVQRGVTDDAALHEARKRAKDLLHALEFLRKLRPGSLHGRIRALHHLTDLLGKDHDLAVLAACLQGPLHGQLTSEELPRILSAIHKTRRYLQRTACIVSKNVYVSSEAAFVKTMHRYWRQGRAARAPAGTSPH